MYIIIKPLVYYNTIFLRLKVWKAIFTVMFINLYRNHVYLYRCEQKILKYYTMWIDRSWAALFIYEKYVVRTIVPGDAMSFNNGQPFSTKDADHDSSGTIHCAVDYHDGGWWFNSCTSTELNGSYVRGHVTNYRAIHWRTFHGGSKIALESSVMMLRRKLWR